MIERTNRIEWLADCLKQGVVKRIVAVSLIFGVAGVSAWAQFGPQNIPPTTPPFFPPNTSRNTTQNTTQNTAQNTSPNTLPNTSFKNAPNNNAPNPNDAAYGDSASHGVARLSLMIGDVTVAHGNLGEMAGAVVNAPLLTEDRVLTGANGRAEVQLDGANLIRLAGSTEVRMGDLQYKRYQVQIAQGLITFRVLRDNDAQVEISTPTVAVHPLRQGIYRVSVSAEGLTEITVRAGEAEIASSTGSETLRAGQTMMSRGSASDPEFRTAAAPAPDDWDRWNADRDRAFENSGDVSRYVPPDVYGAEDLGAYGRWVGDPAYGNVWVPNVGPDWSPYQDGRWTNLDYYGWTWVGYEPWGWAPYHYGRWYRGAYGWTWYPGAIGARYAWSPALVGFFGWGLPGFGASFGLGFGNIGWVPLAPFEVFRPWYGRGIGGSFAGVRSTAIVNNTNIAAVYRNARVNGAVTSMRTGEFGRSGVTASNMVRASAGDLSRASMMNGGVPIAASRESRSFSSSPSAAGNVQGMPRTSNNTRFFSAGSRSTAGAAGTVGRSAGAAGFTNGAASSNGAGNGGAGWRRFDPTTSGSGASGSIGSQRLGGGATMSGSGTPGSQGFAPRGQTFQSSGPQAGGGSQPVRIAPPMVNNRGPVSGSAPQGYAPSGGFGAPRPNFNGNSGGNGGYSAPRAPQGGGPGRSAPSSGGRSAHR